MDKKTITYIAGAAAAAGLASIIYKKMRDNTEAEEEPQIPRGRKPGSSWERYQQRMKEKEKENRPSAGSNKTPAASAAPATPVARVEPKQPKCFCKYCGEAFRDVRAMAYDGRKCFYHPDGSYKGPHALYEGSEKPEYACKYCGQKFRTIRLMAIDGRKCPFHPNGRYKGRHEPAL